MLSPLLLPLLFLPFFPPTSSHPHLPPSFTPVDNPAFFKFYTSALRDINTTYYCPLALRTLTPTPPDIQWTNLPEPCLLCCGNAVRQGICVKRQLDALAGSAFAKFLTWGQSWVDVEGVIGGAVDR